MFDCTDCGAGVIADNGTKCKFFDVCDMCRDFLDDLASFCNEKAEPSISLCWMQCK